VLIRVAMFPERFLLREPRYLVTRKSGLATCSSGIDARFTPDSFRRLSFDLEISFSRQSFTSSLFSFFLGTGLGVRHSVESSRLSTN
jgi:hypothetical protein